MSGEAICRHCGTFYHFGERQKPPADNDAGSTIAEAAPVASNHSRPGRGCFTTSRH
jgi:hypothetical protein